MIPVRAKAPGYYGRYREAGEEFSIEHEDELGSWMQRLDRKEPPLKKGQPAPKPRSNEEIVKPTRADDPKAKDITRTVI